MKPGVCCAATRSPATGWTATASRPDGLAQLACRVGRRARGPAGRSDRAPGPMPQAVPVSARAGSAPLVMNAMNAPDPATEPLASRPGTAGGPSPALTMLTRPAGLPRALGVELPRMRLVRLLEGRWDRPVTL